jgi:hypothetical protein
MLAVERGVDSVDGTFLTYAPDANLARLSAWHDATHPQHSQPMTRPQAA